MVSKLLRENQVGGGGKIPPSTQIRVKETYACLSILRLLHVVIIKVK